MTGRQRRTYMVMAYVVMATSDRQRRTRAHRAQNPNEWWAPPLTRVTTEAVHEPGEWQVRGLHVQQRLFVVSISFG